MELTKQWKYAFKVHSSKQNDDPIPTSTQKTCEIWNNVQIVTIINTFHSP